MAKIILWNKYFHFGMDFNDALFTSLSTSRSVQVFLMINIIIQDIRFISETLSVPSL